MRPDRGARDGAKQDAGRRSNPTRRSPVADVTMKDLLEAGVHLGHQTRRWNPQMKKFIFMERNGIYIIDLQKTLKCIQDARAAITKVTRNGGHQHLVGPEKQGKRKGTEDTRRAPQEH